MSFHRYGRDFVTSLPFLYRKRKTKQKKGRSLIFLIGTQKLLLFKHRLLFLQHTAV